ncbi:hypothetical protein [Salinibius halmophilus]|uniref:hypothetical protein n=1 Tax=Salinibius halmophilus TaxID=1853216 RepID=UPI000E661627|nr:hypothetical protein [Salinibius halmophilus]
MSFAKRHAKARWPFRFLALVTGVLGMFASAHFVTAALSEPATFSEVATAVLVVLTTFASGVIAVSGFAPQWLVPTESE